MKPVLMFYKPTGAGRQKRTKAASDTKANRRTERTDCPYYPTNEDVGVPAVCLRDTSVCKEQERNG